MGKKKKGQKVKAVTLNTRLVVMEAFDNVVTRTPALRLLLGDRFLEGWKRGQGPGLLFIDTAVVGKKCPITEGMVKYTKTLKGDPIEVFQPLIDSIEFVSTSWLDQNYGGRRAWEEQCNPISHRDLLIHKPADWRLQSTGEYSKQTRSPSDTFFFVSLSNTPIGLQVFAGTNWAFYTPAIDGGVALARSVLARADSTPQNAAEADAVKFYGTIANQPELAVLESATKKRMAEHVAQQVAEEKLRADNLDDIGGVDFVSGVAESCHNGACDFAVAQMNVATLSKDLKKQLKRCSACKMVFYCSAACQKADWKSHKAACKQAAQGAAAAAVV